MIRFCRTVLLATLIAISNTVFAAESNIGSSSSARHLTYNGQPLATAALRQVEPAIALTESRAPTDAFGQWGFGHHGHHHDGAVMAMVLGAAGVIAGTATLVYANRPECSVSPYFEGCGYGSKVIGSSVLAGGLAALMIGAVTWR